MTLRRASFAACALFALLFATMPVVLTAAPTSAVDPVVEAVPPRGELWPLTPLADDSFGVSVRALALRREVRMFQWRAETDVDGSVRWSQAWAPERIAIPAALRDDGHINPERMPFQGATWRASTVELDGRTVDPSLYAHFDDWEPFSIDAASLPPNLAASFSSVDGCVHSGEDAANPVVGDLRICWEVLPAGPIEGAVRLEAGRWLTATNDPISRATQREDFALDAPGNGYWLIAGLLGGFLLLVLLFRGRGRN